MNQREHRVVIKVYLVKKNIKKILKNSLEPQNGFENRL